MCCYQYKMERKIPVYNIRNLTKDQHSQKEFLAEPFGEYLQKHYPHLQLPHRHSFYHLVMFTKGAGSHTIDFSRFKVKPFQAYFMMQGQVHSWHFDKEVDGFVINFSETFFRSFLFDASYLERFYFFNGVAEDSVCQLPVEVHEQVTGIFEQLVNYIPNGQGMDMLRVLLLQLFLTIDASVKNTLKKIVPEHKQLLLKNFRRLIEQYYKTIKLPKEYADLLYVTPNHLNALCQDLLDKTAGELIRDRVLLEAKRLLTNAQMSITEIAYELNFKDNSYFSRFFKKQEQMTPEEFRDRFISGANDINPVKRK